MYYIIFLMKNMKIHNLNNIMISPRIHHSWMAIRIGAVKSLFKKYPDLKSNEIPDEQFKEFSSGVGQIFIKVRKTIVKMNVPKDEWSKNK